MSKGIKIHPSAIVGENCQLGNNVEIGSFAIIGDGVILGENTRIMHHAVVDTGTTIGRDCTIYPFCSIGTDPQDITFKRDDPTYVVIGDGNNIREFATINKGTVKGGRYTNIGNNNYFMAYSHIAHDCQVGNNTQLVNGATLAGHVEVENFAVIGAFSSVHQFVRVGRNAYIGGYTIVLQDVLPFAKIAQSRENYNFYGPNSIGMMRNGISRDFIDNVKQIFSILYRQNLNTTQAVETLKSDYAELEEAKIMVDFISKTKRGLLKNFRTQ